MKTNVIALIGFLAFSMADFASAQGNKPSFSLDSLRIAIPFNNCSSDTNSEAGPGFSAGIEFNGKVILFDTGSDFRTLLATAWRFPSGKEINGGDITDIGFSEAVGR